MTKTKNPFSTGKNTGTVKTSSNADADLGGDFGRHKGLLEVLATSDAADVKDKRVQEGYGG